MYEYFIYIYLLFLILLAIIVPRINNVTFKNDWKWNCKKKFTFPFDFSIFF